MILARQKRYTQRSVRPQVLADTDRIATGCGWAAYHAPTRPAGYSINVEVGRTEEFEYDLVLTPEEARHLAGKLADQLEKIARHEATGEWN